VQVVQPATTYAAPPMTVLPTKYTVQQQPVDETLYTRIGGAAAVDAAVDLFYSKIRADPLLEKQFSHVPMEGLKKMQKKFLTKVFGGPDAYDGKSIRDAHRGKGITEEEFGAVAGHLSSTLSDLGVPAKEHGEIMTIAGSVKDDVVEVKGGKKKSSKKKKSKGGCCA